MSDNTADTVSRTDCKPWRDEETLRHYYHERRLSSREVASYLGAGKRTVLRWMEEHKIERRTKRTSHTINTPELLTDADKLRREIVTKERPLEDISDSLGVDQSTVSRWAATHNITERPNSREGGAVECSNCGNTLRRSRWWIENRDNHFCDHSCHGEWCVDNRLGEDNPCWNGGHIEYGRGWNEQKRRTVRERDGFACKACGMSQEAHLEKHSRKLHVHHIQKARDFEDAKERNSVGNLVTLCHSCHVKWEGIPLRPQ